MSDLINARVEKFRKEYRKMVLCDDVSFESWVVDRSVQCAANNFKAHLTATEMNRKRRAEKHWQTVDMFDG